jgi:hypothetical protein
MPSTNAIRAFADKIRAANASNAKQVNLTLQEARNLNHEIEIVLALIVEQQGNAPSGDTIVEIKPTRW